MNKMTMMAVSIALTFGGCASFHASSNVAAESVNVRTAFLEAREAFKGVRDRCETGSEEYKAAWKNYVDARDAYRAVYGNDVKKEKKIGSDESKPLSVMRQAQNLKSAQNQRKVQKQRRVQKSRNVQKLKAATPSVSASQYDILTKRQAAYFKNRRVAQSRDVTTIPGSVIVHYERNGKPDGVTTNVLKSIVGKAQNNHLQEKLKEVGELYVASTNRSAVLRQRFDTWKNGLKLSTSKAIAAELEKVLFKE